MKTPPTPATSTITMMIVSLSDSLTACGARCFTSSSVGTSRTTMSRIDIDHTKDFRVGNENVASLQKKEENKKLRLALHLLRKGTILIIYKDRDSR